MVNREVNLREPDETNATVVRNDWVMSAPEERIMGTYQKVWGTSVGQRRRRALLQTAMRAASKKAAGIGCSSRQVMLRGRSPSWVTYCTGPRKR